MEADEATFRTGGGAYKLFAGEDDTEGARGGGFTGLVALDFAVEPNTAARELFTAESTAPVFWRYAGGPEREALATAELTPSRLRAENAAILPATLLISSLDSSAEEPTGDLVCLRVAAADDANFEAASGFAEIER